MNCFRIENVVLICAFALILHISSGSSFASEEHLSDEELAVQIESIYSTDSQGPLAAQSSDTPQYSGTSLMKIMRRRWDSLSKEIQKRLVQFIEEPVTHGPGAPASQQQIETEHFIVFYETQGISAVPSVDANANSIPDYAENAASYLEKAWDVQVTQFGFKAPPSQNGEKIKCHLKKINHNGLTHAATNVTAWMEIHSDIGAYTESALGAQGAKNITIDPQGMTYGLLKACCAHEFFHCCQASYDWDEQNWWCEATAEWAGDAVFPESKFYTHNVTPRFSNPQISLTSKEGWYEYAASIWAFFLAENYGGPDVIKNIWEASIGKTDVLEATNEVLGDMNEAFTFFACYNYIREYADGARFPKIKELALERSGSLSSIGLKAPQFLGANYFSLIPQNGKTSVEVTFEKTSDEGDVRFMTINGSNWSILPQKCSNGSATLNLDSAQLPEKLAVVVVSFQKTGELSYSLTVK